MNIGDRKENNDKKVAAAGVANSSYTNMMILAALFAALLAVSSWISLPLPFTPVPINLATLVVTLAGAILGKKYGTLSVLVYLLLGAVGIPVFAGFTGGFGHIAGPTGGYIVGYITSAFICALLLDLLCKDKLTWWGIGVSAVAGTASCYILGTIWFMILTNTGLIGALGMCVIPFLPGDIFKLIVSVFLVIMIKPILSRYIQS